MVRIKSSVFLRVARVLLMVARYLLTCPSENNPILQISQLKRGVLSGFKDIVYVTEVF